MYPDPSKLTDQQLTIMAMAADLLVNYTDEYADEQRELFAEIDRRYPGASDRTADHATGNRMTSWEILAWPVMDWEHCRRVQIGAPRYAIGDAVIVDGVAPARVRVEPRGEATPAGHVWVRMDSGDHWGHSFLVRTDRLKGV